MCNMEWFYFNEVQSEWEGISKTKVDEIIKKTRMMRGNSDSPGDAENPVWPAVYIWSHQVNIIILHIHSLFNVILKDL